MAIPDNETTMNLLSIIVNSPVLVEPQEYIGVWLDEDCDKPENVSIKKALSDIFQSFAPFTLWDKCINYINEPRPGKIFFIVSHEIGQYFVPLMVPENIVTIEYIFVFSNKTNAQEYWQSKISDKIRGGFNSLDDLTQAVKNAIKIFNERIRTATTSTTMLNTPPFNSNDHVNVETRFDNQSINNSHFYDVPSTLVLDKNITKTAIKDLSKDHVWFIQFQLLIEIIVGLQNSTQAKEDIVLIFRQHYKDNNCEQDKIKKFEKEAEDYSKAIYWYTAESFIIHLLNRVCSTEDVDHLYYFRLFITNLHKRILELVNDNFTISLRERTKVLYRGKRLSVSAVENFRKSVGNLVAMKGFLSTTVDEDVARFFSGDGIQQEGSVCVVFKLNIVNWEECKSSAAVKPEEGVMPDENEVLFTIGSIWKINEVGKFKDSNTNIWCIELTSCSESDARSDQLIKHFKGQLGQTSDLLALGDFLMKIGQYEKAEKYYQILKKGQNWPEKHVDLAGIYNRLGIIRLERKDLDLAIDYFKKAVDAAPPDSNIKQAADANVENVEIESKRPPTILLGKRLGPSDVISKFLVTNEASTPILKNNLGHTAYIQGKYDEAQKYFEDAIGLMETQEIDYLPEMSCVYNNLGAVAYEEKDYPKAKDYFRKAIFTLQELTSSHPWINEYKENLACAQRHISKRQKIE